MQERWIDLQQAAAGQSQPQIIQTTDGQTLIYQPVQVENQGQPQQAIGFKLFGKHYTIECYSWLVDISLSIAVQNLTSFVEQVHIQQANQSQSNQMIQLPGGSQNGQNVIMMVPNR